MQRNMLDADMHVNSLFSLQTREMVKHMRNKFSVVGLLLHPITLAAGLGGLLLAFWRI